MPMVWYIPPLSPVVDAVSGDGHDGEELGNLFGALEALRIPIGASGRAVHRRRQRHRRGGAALACGDVVDMLHQPRSRDPLDIPQSVCILPRNRCTRCTGCSPSRKTRSATSFRRRTPSKATSSRRLPPSARCRSTPDRECMSRVRSARPAAATVPVAVGNLPRAAAAQNWGGGRHGRQRRVPYPG